MQVVIVGGGTAGSETAWRLRQQDKDARVIILEKGSYTQYSPCALPYVISGDIKAFEDIFLFDSNFYSANKIELKTGCKVESIDREKRQVACQIDGKSEIITYDRLVLAGGCKFSPPDIPGLDQCSYLSLARVDDAKVIRDRVGAGDKALLIGAGYIGIELAAALYKQGLEVTVLEAQDRILPANFDKQMSSKIQAAIEAKGVKIITGAEIKHLDPKQAELGGQAIAYDHLFVCCGLVPDTDLASQAGLECAQGIVVDEQGRTSDENVYACGDAVESINFTDGSKILSQLATTAVRQARVVAGNILGGSKKREKVLNTNISEFDDIVFGSTGMTEVYCGENNIETVRALYRGGTRAEYYPENKDMWVSIVADLNGRIIGCQIAGYEGVAGRVNMAALAIKQKLSLDDLISSETCYNPAIAPIFDPLTIAAEVCRKKLDLKK
jgi:NADH oxidase (H2O2-forming)